MFFARRSSLIRLDFETHLITLNFGAGGGGQYLTYPRKDIGENMPSRDGQTP